MLLQEGQTKRVVNKTGREGDEKEERTEKHGGCFESLK
jgi:hypothetical protein